MTMRKTSRQEVAGRSKAESSRASILRWLPSGVIWGLAIMVCPTQPLAAQQPFASMLEDLRDREYGDVRTNLLAAVEAMPAEKYGFKATPEIRSFAEEVLHGAQVNNRLCGLAENDRGGVEAPTTLDKETVAAFFVASIERCDRVLAETTEENVLQPTFRGYIVGSHLTAMVGHCNHVYGRLTVMMRVAGVDPPTVG